MNLAKFFKVISIRNSGKNQENGEIQDGREQILRFIAGACASGYLLLGISALTQVNVLAFFLFSILTVIVANFVPSNRISYNVKAFFLVSSIFCSGIYAYLSAGQIGDGKLYMLAFTVITGILFGLIPGIAALALSVIPTAIFGYAMSASSSGSSWIIDTVFLAAVGALITISLTVFVSNMQTSLQNEKNAAAGILKKSEELEKNIDKSNQEINRRVQQIRNAYEIARFIGTAQDPTPILKQIVDLIQTDFNLYYVGIFLIDNDQYAVLKSGSGEAGQKMLAAGHRLQIGGSSMIGWCIANRSPRIALDVGSEAVRFNNPELPDTHSELALPILSRGDPLGAITIQSNQPQAFDENDIRIFQGIADSLAISLDNTRLIERAQDSLKEIRSLNKTYLQMGWEKTISSRGELSYTFENSAALNDTDSSYIQIPMTLRDQKIGEVTLETGQSSLSPEDLEFIEAITTQTALALENARLIDETQQKAIQEETVNRLSAELSRGLNIDEIITSAMKEISHLPSVTEVSIFLGTPELTAPVSSNGHNSGGAA